MLGQCLGSDITREGVVIHVGTDDVDDSTGELRVTVPVVRLIPGQDRQGRGFGRHRSGLGKWCDFWPLDAVEVPPQSVIWVVGVQLVHEPRQLSLKLNDASIGSL